MNNYVPGVQFNTLTIFPQSNAYNLNDIARRPLREGNEFPHKILKRF